MSSSLKQRINLPSRRSMDYSSVHDNFLTVLSGSGCALHPPYINLRLLKDDFCNRSYLQTEISPPFKQYSQPRHTPSNRPELLRHERRKSEASVPLIKDYLGSRGSKQRESIEDQSKMLDCKRISQLFDKLVTLKTLKMDQWGKNIKQNKESRLKTLPTPKKSYDFRMKIKGSKQLKREFKSKLEDYKKSLQTKNTSSLYPQQLNSNMHKLHNLTVVDYYPKVINKRQKDWARPFIIKRRSKSKQAKINNYRQSNSLEIEPWDIQP